MFNKRLQHDFIIPNAGLHRVYLLEESDTGGTWPVIKGEGEPVKLPTGNPNNKIYTPILPGILTWRIVIRNQAERDVIDAVFESIEGDYRVEYYQVEGGITENLIWRGDLLLDQYNEDLRGFPGFVEIVASDLGKLQGLNYLDINGFPHTGRESQLQIIKNCVQLLGYGLGFACSDAIYEDTMDGNPLTDDPMLQAYADNAWYYPVDSFGQTRLMSAWDVLRSILVSKACRIRQWGGRWHVEQIVDGVEPEPLSNGDVLIPKAGGTNYIIRNTLQGDAIIHTNTGTENTQGACYYTPDFFKVVGSATNDGTIRIFDPNNQLIRSFTVGFFINYIVVDGDKNIYLWSNGIRKFDWEGNFLWDYDDPAGGFSISEMDVYIDGEVVAISRSGLSTGGNTKIIRLDPDGNLLLDKLITINDTDPVDSWGGYVKWDMDKNIIIAFNGATGSASYRRLEKRSRNGLMMWSIANTLFSHRILLVGHDNMIYHGYGSTLQKRDTSGLAIAAYNKASGTLDPSTRNWSIDNIGNILEKGAGGSGGVDYTRIDYETMNPVVQVMTEGNDDNLSIATHPGSFATIIGTIPDPDAPMVFVRTFDNDTIGSGLPADFRPTWNDAQYTQDIVTDHGLPSEKALQLTNSGANYKACQWLLPNQNNFGDIDILIRGRMYTTGTNMMIGAVIDCYGSPTNRNGYITELLVGAGLRLRNMVANTPTTLDTDAFDNTTAPLYVRAQRQDGRLKSKIWLAEDTQPDWMIDEPDPGTHPIESVGLVSFGIGSIAIDYISVGTMGEEPQVPLTVLNLLTLPKNEEIQVDWSAPTPAPGVQGYSVYVDGVKHNPANIITTTYNITGVTNEQEYDIQVRTVTAAGEVAFSKIVKETPFNGYYNDFRGYTVDEQPSDWTRRWNAAAGQFKVQGKNDAKAGKVLEFIAGNTTAHDRGLTWDFMDSIAGRGNIEIEMRFQQAAVGSGNQSDTRTVIRGSGDTPGAINTYASGMRNVNSSNQGLRITKYTAGSFTLLASSLAVPFDINVWKRQKIYMDSDHLHRAKCWLESASEPDWQVSETDGTPITGDGWVGIYCIGYGTFIIDWIKIRML